MTLTQTFKVALIAAQLINSVSSAPLVETRDNVCSSGIYGELSPILKLYPIAQEFCTIFYPVSCTSGAVKRTVSSTSTMTAAATKSLASTSNTKTTVQTAAVTILKSTVTSTAATTKPTSTGDFKVSAYNRMQRQPGNVVRTMCSCIETPKVSSFRT